MRKELSDSFLVGSSVRINRLFCPHLVVVKAGSAEWFARLKTKETNPSGLRSNHQTIPSVNHHMADWARVSVPEGARKKHKVSRSQPTPALIPSEPDLTSLRQKAKLPPTASRK